MQHSPLMRESYCFGDGCYQLRRLPSGQGLVLSHVGEAAALNQVHREVQLPTVFTHFVDRNDVRMVQAGRCLCLPLKTSDECFIGKLATQENLDRHLPVKTQLSRAIDDSHASTGKFFQKFVTT